MVLRYLAGCTATAGLAIYRKKASMLDGHSPERGPVSLFDDPSLRDSLFPRNAAELELKLFMSKAGPRDADLNKELWEAKKHATRAFALARLQDHRESMHRRIEDIVYPSAPFRGARQRYISSFGCVAWTEDALKAIKRWAPQGVVELGAGGGYWATALRVRGVDVLAFDNMSSLPDPSRDVARFAAASSTHLSEFPTARPAVVRGDEAVLSRRGVYRRALLLVYPPPGPMAADCLKHFQGDTLVFVGEARGGVNASEAFFDALDKGNSKGWCLVHAEDVSPFPGGHERLYVFRQRKFPMALQMPFARVA
mmetsp:Transcript_60379/g.103976  ORF Transcript_60379/g.103976 Transcript_60379/m.103976 type:complete len:310 (+) Transcript_60379:71-1000(+)